MTVLALSPLTAGVLSKTAAPAASTAARALLLGGILGYRHPELPEEPSNDVYRGWMTKVASPIRFFISGNLGNLAFFLFEGLALKHLVGMQQLSGAVEEYGKDSVAFFIGYAMQIVVQHLLHAVLVYGTHSVNSFSRYFWTLFGETFIYVAALFGSTFLNMTLLRQAQLDKTLAFGITMATFACVNFYLIGTWVRWVIQWTEPNPNISSAAAAADKRGAVVASSPLPSSVIKSNNDLRKRSPDTRDEYDDEHNGVLAMLKNNESTAAIGAVGATLVAGALALLGTVLGGSDTDDDDAGRVNARPPPLPPKDYAVKPAVKRLASKPPPPKTKPAAVAGSYMDAIPKARAGRPPQRVIKDLFKNIGVGPDTEGMDVQDLQIDGSTIDRASK